MAENNSTDSNTGSDNTEASIPRPVRFWLLLILDVLAVTCTLFLLFHLFSKKILRQGLHNHVIIALLIVALWSQLIDIPSYITYLYLGYVWIQHPLFCSLWLFVALGLFNMIGMLMAFGSIERHILVFHSQWLRTQRKRMLIHYLPLFSVIFYGSVFYIVVCFFLHCENTFDYNQIWCSYTCFAGDTTFAMYDVIVNSIFPTLLIVIFSAALFIRYIWQKRRIQRGIQWRKHRKMAIQLLSVSSLHLMLNLPGLILITANLCGLPLAVDVTVQLYIYFLTYFIPLLLPYVCLASLPELWKKFKIHPICYRAMRLRLTTTVAPLNTNNRQ